MSKDVQVTQRILDALTAQRNEKMVKLTSMYEERSSWLESEFSKIRKLIKQNPRDALAAAASSSFVGG